MYGDQLITTAESKLVRKNPSPRWVLKRKKAAGQNVLWRKHQLLERVVGDTLHLSVFLWAVFPVILSHASSSLVWAAHTYPSLSSSGVKQTHALWLKSSLIYFTCSNWMSSCWYALNKNSWILFLIIFTQIFSHRACTLHRGFGYYISHTTWLLNNSVDLQAN